MAKDLPLHLHLQFFQNSLKNSWISFCLFPFLFPYLLSLLSFRILLYSQWDHNPRRLQRYCKINSEIFQILLRCYLLCISENSAHFDLPLKFLLCDDQSDGGSNHKKIPQATKLITMITVCGFLLHLIGFFHASQ